MRISDWSSDVCSSDLHELLQVVRPQSRCPRARYSSLRISIRREVVRPNAPARRSPAYSAGGAAAAVQTRLTLRSYSSSTSVTKRRARSEERRVGKECVSTCRSWGSAYHQQKKH